MRVLQVIQQLVPNVPVLATTGDHNISLAKYRTCPTWPPDIFAIVGTIIDRSGCYTEASPNPTALDEHRGYLKDVEEIVASWTDIFVVPVTVERLWSELIDTHSNLTLDELNDNPDALKTLFKLFAIADEASQGMGWSLDDPSQPNDFQMAVLINAVPGDASATFKLPHWPRSLCLAVAPDQVVVLPKSITADKGCTVRSLSHNLALLPCETVLKPEWRFVERTSPEEDLTELRLLLIPFPFEIPDDCFELAYGAEAMGNGTTHAAFFKLRQNWLKNADGTKLTANKLANELILPLIEAAKKEAGGKVPHGVILPECALNERITAELGMKLRASGIEFLICGVLDDERSGRPLNKAYTIFMDNDVAAPQNKQHRWRIDKQQADSYQLDFDKSSNRQWWENIDVSKRGLPFYAFRKDTSMVTLICEDLARMEPAMNAIRAVGPNLVVALLMDGPQLGSRWSGRYAGVLADEPGCSVLSITCAATVDRSNLHYRATAVAAGKTAQPTKRIIGRWTERDGTAHDIDLPEKTMGVLLTLQSDERHQTTLDNRGDKKRSRELGFEKQTALAIN